MYFALESILGINQQLGKSVGFDFNSDYNCMKSTHLRDNIMIIIMTRSVLVIFVKFFMPSLYESFNIWKKAMKWTDS